MRFGIRKISLKKRISSRFSLKRQIIHRGGLKMPKGLGILRNPKKAIYNKIYNKSTLSLVNLPKSTVKIKNPNLSSIQEIDWEKVNILRDLAFEQTNKHKYHEAEKTLKKALKITDQLGGGILYDMLGEIYLKEEKYDKALEMFYKSLKVSSSAKKRKKISKIHKLSSVTPKKKIL